MTKHVSILDLEKNNSFVVYKPSLVYNSKHDSISSSADISADLFLELDNFFLKPGDLLKTVDYDAPMFPRELQITENILQSYKDKILLQINSKTYDFTNLYSFIWKFFYHDSDFLKNIPNKNFFFKRAFITITNIKNDKAVPVGTLYLECIHLKNFYLNFSLFDFFLQNNFQIEVPNRYQTEKSSDWNPIVNKFETIFAKNSIKDYLLNKGLKVVDNG